MKLGITGNTGKPGLWKPVADLISFLKESSYPFVLHPELGLGLSHEGFEIESESVARDLTDFLNQSDIVISFGGDGTLLNTVYELGEHPIPILGVNYGRLGFLAHVEQSELTNRMHQLEKGDYQVEERLVLEATYGEPANLQKVWALNEFTIQRSGETGLLAPEGDVSAFAAAISALARDAERRQKMGRAAVERVARDHTLASAAGQLNVIINDVIQRRVA